MIRALSIEQFMTYIKCISSFWLVSLTKHENGSKEKYQYFLFFNPLKHMSKHGNRRLTPEKYYCPIFFIQKCGHTLGHKNVKFSSITVKYLNELNKNSKLYYLKQYLISWSKSFQRH